MSCQAPIVKKPADRLDWVFDFDRWLTDGDAILSTQVLIDGVDKNTLDVLSGALNGLSMNDGAMNEFQFEDDLPPDEFMAKPIIEAGQRVRIFVWGGKDGQQFGLRLRIWTAQGRARSECIQARVTSCR